MKRSQIFKVLVFLAIFIIHSVAQFIAFAYADSPTRNSGLMRMLWGILGAPLFHITGSLANLWVGQYFLVVGIANSLLWSALWTYVIVRLALRKRRPGSDSGPQRT